MGSMGVTIVWRKDFLDTVKSLEVTLGFQRGLIFNDKVLLRERSKDI